MSQKKEPDTESHRRLHPNGRHNFMERTILTTLSSDILSSRIERSRKPLKCPACGHKPVATIMYGYPIECPELDAEIEAGKVVLGGCVLYEVNPAWQCTSCDREIFRLPKASTSARPIA